MSTNWQPSDPSQPQEPAQEWAQPPFVPTEQPIQPNPYQSGVPNPYPPAVVHGSVILPAEQVPPPSPAESALRAAARVLPPILIFAAIFIPGFPWWVAIVGVVIASSALGQVTRDMRRRRIAAAREQRVLPPDSTDYR